MAEIVSIPSVEAIHCTLEFLKLYSIPNLDLDSNSFNEVSISEAIDIRLETRRKNVNLDAIKKSLS